MINVGNVDGYGLDQEMFGKLVFMEFQQQGMGMGYFVYFICFLYQIYYYFSQYGDSVFFNLQIRLLLGYLFYMNLMFLLFYNFFIGYLFFMFLYQSFFFIWDGKLFIDIFICLVVSVKFKYYI